MERRKKFFIACLGIIFVVVYTATGTYLYNTKLYETYQHVNVWAYIVFFASCISTVSFTILWNSFLDRNKDKSLVSILGFIVWELYPIYLVFQKELKLTDKMDIYILLGGVILILIGSFISALKYHRRTKNDIFK